MNPGKNTVYVTNNNAVSFLAGAGSGDEENSGNDRNGFILGSEDEMIPLNVVERIMLKALPPNSKITDEAKTAVQSCLSEYIGFMTSEANDRCHQQMRKTIFAEDILFAFSKLGFDSYIEPLTLYLNRYRQYEAERNANGGEPTTVRRTVSYPQYEAEHNANANAVGGEPTVRRTVSYPQYEAEHNAMGGEPIVRRTMSYPLTGVVQQSLPHPPPPPMMYYIAPEHATQFTPLHPNLISTYYRAPPAPVAYTGGMTMIPVYGPGGCGNAFPGGYGGVPFNAMGAVTAQVCCPRGEHFININAQPTSPGGSCGSTSDDVQYTRGNAGHVSTVRNMRFKAPGSSRGGGRPRRF